MFVGLFKGIRRIIKQPYAVIVPPAGYGSIGDDAMVRVLIRESKKRGLVPILLGGSDAITWSHIWKVKTADYRKKVTTTVNLMMLLLKSRNLYIIGADIMDGHYDVDLVRRRLKLARVFSRIGIDTSVTGFSFNNPPNKVLCEEFNKLNGVNLFLRDIPSLERFESKTKSKGIISADLAFLTQFSGSDKNVKNIIEWVDAKKKDGKIVIIVNINWLPFRSSELSVNELIQRYTEICLEVNRGLNNGASFLIVPNDFRDSEKLGDRKLLKLLHDSLLVELGSNCKLVDIDFNSEELKLFSEKCDFVITGRMHLAIITATNSIPAFSVSYQAKFGGFYKYIGLERMDLMIEPHELLENHVASRILANIHKRHELSSKISDELPEIQGMVEKCLYQV